MGKGPKSWPRALTAGAVAAGSVGTALLASATGAGANVPSPYTRSDNARDVNTGGGDITSVTVTHSGNIVGKVTLLVQTRGAVSPFTSPAWTTGDSRISWFIDTDGVAGVDAKIVVAPADGGTVSTTLYKGGNPYTTCPLGNPTFSYVNGNQFQVDVYRTCLNADYPTDYTSLKARVEFRYDPPALSPRTDRAPNRGYTPRIDAGI